MITPEIERLFFLSLVLTMWGREYHTAGRRCQTMVLKAALAALAEQ
ncbi:hypothetical protein [Wielerella bovis]|nr:hypothetical protein [Wielerella bovis]MCG7657142.1 hypothetical protein [Wielerella bovis]MCG7659365.1 hypothetical protein [Wielerella bovis]